MSKIFYLFFLVISLSACTTTPTLVCNTDESLFKYGRNLNTIRLQYGVPIIHDYLCAEKTGGKMETWDFPNHIQDTIKTGFHAGKGIFLTTDGILEEKDIFRKRITDSSFIMLGVLSYVSKDGKVEFENIWYDTVPAGSIDLSRNTNNPGGRNHHVKHHLSITQMDSILTSWNTSRFK